MARERDEMTGPAHWDARYAASPELEWGAQPNRWVAAQSAGLAPGRALDLGAGEGRNAVWLAEQGWRVTAVDFSAVGLEKGRRLADAHGVGAALEWVQADVTTYQAPEAAYDLVLAAYLHLSEPARRRTLRSAAAALAPGGTLLVIGHDLRNLSEGVGGPQDPRVLFTPDDVVEDLSGTGLVVVTAEPVQRRVAGAGDRVALDATARLTRSRTR